MPKDKLDRAVDRWRACWRELQTIEAQGPGHEARIDKLKREIAELQPAVNVWKRRRFFSRA